MIQTKEELFIAELGGNPQQEIELSYGAKIKITDLLSKYLKAINYTHCCTQLLCVSDDFNFVTKGRVYNMEDEPDGHYVIIDDFGEKRLLWKHYFEIVQ